MVSGLDNLSCFDGVFILLSSRCPSTVNFSPPVTLATKSGTFTLSGTSSFEDTIDFPRSPCVFSPDTKTSDSENPSLNTGNSSLVGASFGTRDSTLSGDTTSFTPLRTTRSLIGVTSTVREFSTTFPSGKTL